MTRGRLGVVGALLFMLALGIAASPGLLDSPPPARVAATGLLLKVRVTELDEEKRRRLIPALTPVDHEGARRRLWSLLTPEASEVRLDAGESHIFALTEGRSLRVTVGARGEGAEWPVTLGVDSPGGGEFRPGPAAIFLTETPQLVVFRFDAPDLVVTLHGSEPLRFSP